MNTGEGYRGALAELITIYRKMKKGRDTLNIYQTRKDQIFDESAETAAETAQTVPRVRRPETKEDEYQMIFNFCALNMINPAGSKYLFYSRDAALLQAQTLDELTATADFSKSGFFWLNTFNPTDSELYSLGEMFNIHSLSVLDIKERNTDEKIEVFKHYTFISMKLFVETQSNTEDIDFNILVFKDFVLTFHDKPWISVHDTFNFIDLLAKYTPLTPSWVLYSIVVEFLQDIKYLTDNCRTQINHIQEQSKSLEGPQMADVLKSNFAVTCQVNNLQASARNKLDILGTLKSRCRKRIVPLVQKYLTESIDDLKEQYKRLSEHHRVLERSQDTYLALLNVAQTQEGNEMNKSMSRMSLVALIISPCQLLSGLWGMNVKVPWGDTDDYYPFVVIIILSMLPILVYFYRPLWRALETRRQK
ncbi:magnesium transporter [Nematocida homosporus]|uniref:magnesium transporter n=1 Tax=Nematocida homosporus TaxID=1912981 RepID=UPI00221ED869|nr:magnesium transporter [Nematocida homosporus]KAI5186890.1 magnesium transporter [Nematocida homosporus]